MVRWEGGGEEGGKKAGVVVAAGARVLVKGGSPSPCPCANSWCSATPRAMSRSPAPRTRDRTVRARSRGVPRPRVVCRALRDDASSESRALVCSAVSGVTRFWQQVKSLACFFWSKRWCLGKDDADGRPRRLREDAPSSDVWCAMESRSVDLGDDVRVGKRDTCSRDDDTAERFQGSRRRDSPAQHERPGR